MQLESRLQKSLEKRKDQGNLRQLSHQKGSIDFYSNDYLGLARNQELFEQIKTEQQKWPSNGATGSRLLSGNHRIAEDVETQLAQIFHSEKALLFNSGYSANQSILSSVPQKGDTIIYDELSHACIKEGARLSLAKRYTFKHNSLQDLQHKLSISQGQAFVIIESVYSMDGDTAPLEEIIELCKQYEAALIIDEAHTTGVIGEAGAGFCVDKKLEDHLFARIYTFGKAMGIHGACIAGSQTMIDYLVNFARPFIYTTALPPHSILAIKCAFNYLKNNQHLQVDLKNKVSLFNQKFDNQLAQSFTKITSNHPIQSILIPGNLEVRRIAEMLQHNDLDVRPILSPTVKKGEERLRICLHTFNSAHDISKLIDTLAGLK